MSVWPNMPVNWKRTVLLACLVLSLVTDKANYASGQRLVDLRSSATLDGPPRRPSKFTTTAQLNDYLTELRDYYSVLARPRFGKRSRRIDDSARWIIGQNKRHYFDIYELVQRLNRPS
ncbi:hypothetical protein LSAT2_019599 [Lamellibrachia satsuma]|nr:hypothetical protein LSAT2_019599 [Lamellibrachia satsuma]